MVGCASCVELLLVGRQVFAPKKAVVSVYFWTGRTRGGWGWGGQKELCIVPQNAPWTVPLRVGTRTAEVKPT